MVVIFALKTGMESFLLCAGLTQFRRRGNWFSWMYPQFSLSVSTLLALALQLFPAVLDPPLVGLPRPAF